MAAHSQRGLATVDPVHSFRPVWTPSFVTRLAPEDRCHLNGLAVSPAGEPLYVTAAGRSDMVGGWRERRTDRGVIVDVSTDHIICDGLSMAHSPRVVGSDIVFLESGRGRIVRLNRATGQ